jgi:hypothetical protein
MGSRAREEASRAICLLVVGALASCGNQPAPDFRIRNAGVVVRSEAAFTNRADFPARVETTLDAALRYWGGTWDQLEGKTIVFEGERHVACGGTTDAVGCYDGEIRVSTQDAGQTVRCVEETVLVHEVGHAVIGDPDHTDPRWMDFSPVARDLDGRPGYDDHGDVPCRIYLSLWRHPPPASGPAGLAVAAAN